ncbi:deoxyguanosinetriphosphate triphosphohydrolase family protein [Marinomonas sp. M1K-6]|uniref:Deoxyguanosinetriphosphate triphosphohydrolase-like protein n=1 Tax=Marinomonas profundi TaxID=2726122 RepID=A0A847R3C1_9GAMM|nr:anti-phage deoxyguanosine triphosphatase [Marinomonas profundi]NLQ18415.1 deoxyguanosinetriphosphate triphosphohydrolase family protein [Marinomonas profundi]UDV02469.1 deoxyguanosinetriphosphate triphosphohydrolase family protein [Marinomonas profundi]
MTNAHNEMLPWHERQSGHQESRDNDYRTPYQRDRARIIHSAAFRRLQSKTQILAIRQNDYSRTRLTHSLEVAQIGNGIVHQLKHSNPANANFQPWLADDALIETVCLSHDIGHPPFGHGGEVALNYMMQTHGGFEGNAQSLRILGKRGSYSPTYGMDVTRRTLLGILKYPVLHASVVGQYPEKLANFRQFKASHWAPPKCVYQEEQDLLNWIIEPFSQADRALLQEVNQTNPDSHAKAKHASFDTSIMDLADDIAYGVHDLEDAIVLNMVTKDMWLEHLEPKLAALASPFLAENLNDIRTQLFSRQSHLRKEAIGSLVSWFITSCRVIEKPQFEHPLLRFQVGLPEGLRQALNLLKQFEMQHIIQRPEVQMLVYKGQQMLLEMFEAYSADPARLLPREIANEWQRSQERGENGLRIICDYMASMTDDYASRMYNKLFVPSLGSVFEPM